LITEGKDNIEKLRKEYDPSLEDELINFEDNNEDKSEINKEKDIKENKIEENNNAKENNINESQNKNISEEKKYNPNEIDN
jgi:hypothetical protein